MKILKFLGLFLVLSLAMFSCNGDPDPITVSSIQAVGTSFQDGSAVTKDLNGVASAEDVPLDAIITATFDMGLDVSTGNALNVSLTSSQGEVSRVVSSTGSTVTVDPQDELERGTLYTLAMTGIKSADGADLPSTTRTFTTEGRAPVVVPNVESMMAYYTFDGTPDDALGSYPAGKVEAITYGNDRFDQGNSVASFDGDASIIEIPMGDEFMAANDLTLSFWMKTNSNDHLDANGNPASFFVMGLAAFKGFQFEVPADFSNCKVANHYVTSDGTLVAEDSWFNGSGEDKDNNGWQGWDFVKDLSGAGGVEALLKDKWAHIIWSYNAAEKQSTLYINGDLMKSHDFDLWPEGDIKRTVTGVAYNGEEPSELPELAFGFIHSSGGTLWDTEPWGSYDLPTSNHFKGDLDDIRIFSAPFSPADAEALYNAEKN